MTNWQKTKDDKYDTKPISIELKNLLFEMGLKENQGKDQYLLTPFENIKRETVVKQMSAGFSFFRDKAGVSKKYCFENLRKTYFSQIQFLQSQGLDLTSNSHSNKSVLVNHYHDQQIIAKQTTQNGFKLFDEDIN